MGHSQIKDQCCNDLKFHMEEMEKLIIYLPTDRSYLIRINNHIGQEIKFCPWCGSKLPENLTEARAKIIFDEMNLDSYEDPRLPEEFKTDEWWKKRGL